MGRKKNDDHIRTITKVAGGKSYCITLPIKIVREMNWESQQKVLVRRRGNKVIIQDQFDEPGADGSGLADVVKLTITSSGSKEPGS